MNLYLIKSRKKVWTSGNARSAIGVQNWGNVTLTCKNKSINRQVKRAPKAAARCIDAAFKAFGKYGIAVTSSDLSDLGAVQGDVVAVTKQDTEVAQQTASSSAPSKAPKASSARGRMSVTKVGERMEVSHSYAQSGFYSDAKKLGMKFKKAGDCLIERLS